MRFIALVGVLILAGCSAGNIVRGQDDFCRQLNADFRQSFERAIQREVAEEPPSGALTQPYSRDLWNDYWNDRIYYMWHIGPESCNGTWEGASGPEMIRYMLARRESLDLPEIKLEQRNADKNL
jgi:hypothetical protein